MAKFDYITIEQNSSGATYQNTDGRWTIYGHGVYANSSVLAGRPCRNWLGVKDTLLEAVEFCADKYPGIEVVDDTGSSYQELHLPETPPDWFDPAVAGETW